MLQSDKIKKYLKIMEKEINCSATALEQLNELDYQKMIVVLDIIKGKDNRSEKEWFEIYDKYKNDDSIVYSIIKIPECPQNLLDLISSNINIYNENPFNLLYKTLLEREISDTCFRHIADGTDSFFFKGIFDSFTYENVPLKESSLPQENIKKIAKFMLEEAINEFIENKGDEDPVYNIYDVPSTYYSLALISDRDFLKNILEQNYNDCEIPNIAASMILNNIYLDDTNKVDEEIIKLAYHYSDPIKIGKIHKCLAEALGDSMHDAFINNCIDKSTGHYNYAKDFYSIRHFLEKMAETGNLNSKIERDLANHLVCMRLQYRDGLISAIFNNTSDPVIIKQIDELFRDNKIDAYLKNPHIPETMLKSKVNEYHKAMSIKSNGKIPKIPENWYYYLSNFAKRVEFKSEMYDLLVKPYAFKKELIFNILSSEKTPVNKIEDYYSEMKEMSESITGKDSDDIDTLEAISPSIATICKFALFCREENLNLNYIDNFAQTISYNTVYNNKFLMDNLDDSIKIKRFFEEYSLSKDISFGEKNIAEKMVNLIDKALLKIKQSEGFTVSPEMREYHRFIQNLCSLERNFEKHFVALYYETANILSDIDDIYEKNYKNNPEFLKFSINQNLNEIDDNNLYW